MNNNNIENNNGEDDEHQQQQAQAEQQQHHQDVVVFDAAAGNVNTTRRKRRLKLAITVLERNEKFPLRNRNKIDELVETFLEELGDDIHEMLCDNDIDDGDYHGLDSDRDTENEVETAIQLFPEILTRRTTEWWSDSKQRMILGEYPIQHLAPNTGCYVKAVSFIPIVARVSIELGVLFGGEEERGGLLCQENDNDFNVLQNLMDSDYTAIRWEQHEPVDTKYLHVLIQLRKLGLLKKEDIQRYRLLDKLCSNCYYFFAENRFKFLVEWDPSALTQTCEDGQLPIHYAAKDSPIRGFQLVFEYGILYYPKQNGIHLLFRHKYDDPFHNDGKTPFEIACEEFGYEQVIEVVEETLIRYSSSSNNTPPFNIMEALITAAIDENIHLDCVYFLLRREPDVLMKLLSSTPPPLPPAMDNNNNSNNDDNGGNDGNSNVLVTRTMDSNKKRKRE
jgi:hypothetical protein